MSNRNPGFGVLNRIAHGLSESESPRIGPAAWEAGAGRVAIEMRRGSESQGRQNGLAEACFRRQQALYFLPDPHGQGSFRPTFFPTLRTGSRFFSVDC